MATDARTELKRLIARFQHAHESLHRHPNGGASCEYCELVGHFAVRTILDHPAETVALLVEAGVLVPFTKFRQRFERGRIQVMQASEMWMDGEQLYRLSLPTSENNDA